MQRRIMQKLFSTKLPVVIKFWAPWCVPCKAFAPIFYNISKLYADKVEILDINVEEDETAARDFSITSVPLILIYKEHVLIERIDGVVPALKLKEVFDKVTKEV